MVQTPGYDPRCTAILLAVLVGCGGMGCGGTGADQPDLGIVAGVVELDGKPLQSAKVEFLPENGRLSTGQTNARGEYELDYKFDTKGAKVGSHTVRIWTFETSDDPETGEPKITTEERVPVVYNSETTLTETVKPGEQEINFDLDSKAGRIVQKSPDDQ